MKELVIIESEVASSEQFHTLMARGLEFPSYYGANLAALNDCLEDIDTPTRIVIRIDLEEHEQWFEKMVAVTHRAAENNDFLELYAYDDDLKTTSDPREGAIPAKTAIERLKEGNLIYWRGLRRENDISTQFVHDLSVNGQRPYACVVACADSRVVPEQIFDVGLGDLFTIRVAGNVVGDVEMASILYACEHLHTKLVLVLGHTNCGAIEAAMDGHTHGTVGAITKKVARAIGEERDPYVASVLNVRAALSSIVSNDELFELLNNANVEVHGAIYHTHSKKVDFLD